jgi:hypothetical protein
MKASAVAQQIRDVTHILLNASLIDYQRPPVVKVIGGISHIGIPDAPDLSVSMRDLAYDDIYQTLFATGAYHFRMLDGALIQLLYSFSRKNLVSHRLCYFPAPNLATFDAEPELYEHDELYANIFSHFTIKAPLRIDFDSDDDKFVEIDHPRCHASLGQYKDCRIPVDGPMTPFRFMRFILRSFYYRAYVEINFDNKASETSFDATIADPERRVLYISA